MTAIFMEVLRVRHQRTQCGPGRAAEIAIGYDIRWRLRGGDQWRLVITGDPTTALQHPTASLCRDGRVEIGLAELIAAAGDVGSAD